MLPAVRFLPPFLLFHRMRGFTGDRIEVSRILRRHTIAQPEGVANDFGI